MADGWIRAMPLDELQDARPRRIAVDGTEAFVVRNGEALYAGSAAPTKEHRSTVACCTSPALRSR